MMQMVPIASRMARYAFWPALAFALVMAVLPHPPKLAGLDVGDKVQHMLAFFVLTGLAGAGWPRLPLLRLALWLALVGAGIELVQAIPSLNRTSDWRDWAADSVAILAAFVPVALFRQVIERTEAR
ncbi:MAG: hypothetical protein ACK4UL_02400 [Novosphingobium meiothermophilum]|uniref:hypothetical protein n=1 Tax=Novosphingobium TaxID=165696 RepID=UPI001F2C3917|nr:MULTISPECIES: hypothetical protein [Novosphingobium]